MLKILFSVILLSAISQLSSSNMRYVQSRINFGHNYRSQCASYLCSGPQFNWFENKWNECVRKYIPWEKAWAGPHSVKENPQIMRRRYFQRDCVAIGGIMQSSGEIQVGRGSQETYKCQPSHPSGRFITLACGFKQN
jgi:hypothetical protein